MNKKCNKCEKDLDITNFYKGVMIKNVQHYQSSCKICYKNAGRDYIQNNKESRKEYRKKWNNDNIKRIKKYMNKYDYLNSDKKKDYMKSYQPKRNILEKERRRNDPNYKLSCSLRSKLIRAVKENKINSALILLGCTIFEFKQHLESQFLPEMNWSNHGTVWEIDHIKSISSFNLMILEEQKQCFHYINMQPLFKTTAIAKSFGYTDQIGNRNKSK